MTPSTTTPWIVLNVDGRDPSQDFSLGCGPDHGAHPPVNYHAFAACTKGRFEKRTAAIPEATPVVLILLRQRNLIAAKAAIRQLKAAGTRVWISLKESGAIQAAEFAADPRRWFEFSELCEMADGCLSTTQDLVCLYLAAGARRCEFVPTPYPVDRPEWNFGCGIKEKTGIFVGTREFDVPSRQHLTAVATACRVARDLECRVVTVNTDGRHGEKFLELVRRASGIENRLEIVEGRKSYPDYLRLMASCRVVWQLDRSRVPGQVAGDALLCGIPCVGGDGAVDRIGHPLTNGHGRSDVDLTAVLAEILTNDAAYAETLAASQSSARAHLSFDVIAAQLDSLVR